ncbi:MAG: LysR family transcriptional regulator [Vannielia sp.]|uniref:LysR family transcriptional regulator n=1 Tax=Rhodobacterales TaxID=204455 RepID=UPI002094F600|nr:LysR family transcriptional regulator [Oceanicola sp. 502str15]MCO6385108.1 LysR family transcriptional regulator [Oceanicola sp. 502str15]
MNSLDTWDEVRTAYHVARVGTVSGAADALGVHHATVIRHIDALETRLGTKLFQRHARGYTATEAGLDLLQVAKATDDQFSQLAGRIKGRGEEVTGELIVTSIPSLSPSLTATLASYSRANPQVTLRFMTDERLFRLEYGEAHVAIRAGKRPDQPDNVVQKFFELGHALYATQDYVDEMGPLDEDDMTRHRFVSEDDRDSRAPFYRWLHEMVPDRCITYRASAQRSVVDAIRAGAGIGFLPEAAGDRQPDLVKMMSTREEWRAAVWLVTHVDLHRTAKVQSILTHLKETYDPSTM